MKNMNAAPQSTYDGPEATMARMNSAENQQALGRAMDEARAPGAFGGFETPEAQRDAQASFNQYNSDQLRYRVANGEDPFGRTQAQAPEVMQNTAEQEAKVSRIRKFGNKVLSMFMRKGESRVAGVQPQSPANYPAPDYNPFVSVNTQPQFRSDNYNNQQF